MNSTSQSKSIRHLGGSKKSSSFQLPQNSSFSDSNTLLKSVDTRLAWTYNGIATKQISSVTEQSTIFPNNMLYQYIKYIYDKYSIRDPLSKYQSSQFLGNTQTYDNYQNLSNRGSITRPTNDFSSNFYHNKSQPQSNISFNPDAISKQLGFQNNFKQEKNINQSRLDQSFQNKNKKQSNIQPLPFDKNNSSQANQNNNNVQMLGVENYRLAMLDQASQKNRFDPRQTMYRSPEKSTQRYYHSPQTKQRNTENNSKTFSYGFPDYQKGYKTERQTISQRPRMSDGREEQSYMYRHPNKLPEVPLNNSIIQRHRDEYANYQKKRPSFDHTQTGISRKSEEPTDQNFSISENIKRRQHTAYQYPPYQRLDSKNGVISKSTTFDQQNLNLQHNPQDKNDGRRMAQVPSKHHHTPSDIPIRTSNEPEPVGYRMREDKQGIQISNAFNTPSRGDIKRGEDRTTQHRQKNRFQRSSQDKTIMKNYNMDYQSNRNNTGFDRYSIFTNGDNEIPSIYRYCFVCEQLILEHNISIHEVKCGGFQSLYEKSYEQILRILVVKIKRMQGQIQEIVCSQEEDRLKDLRSSVSTWLSSVSGVSQDGRNSLEMQRNYGQIMKCFRSRELQLLQLSHKLKWFLSIRQHIKESFSL